MTYSIITKTFKPMLGLPCWGLHYQRNLNLSLNFGEPSLKLREPVESKSKLEAVRRSFARRIATLKGEWWLWIYCSHWKIALKDCGAVTGASSLRKIEEAMLFLQGQKLTAVEIRPLIGATRFRFDLGGELHCRRFDRDGEHDELWTLYKPRGYVLAIYGDGTFTHHLGSKDGPRKRIAMRE